MAPSAPAPLEKARGGGSPKPGHCPAEDRSLHDGTGGRGSLRSQERRLWEQGGLASDRTSRMGVVEATRPVPNARVVTVVQLQVFLLQGRCRGCLVDWLVDTGASTTRLSVTEWKYIRGCQNFG